MIAALLGEILPYVVGLGAVVAAFFGYGWKKSRDAKRAERQRMKDADMEEALRTKRRLEDALDDDRDVSPADRLREQGRLRD